VTLDDLSAKLLHLNRCWSPAFLQA